MIKYQMNAWDQLMAENSADHRATMNNKCCHLCHTPLIDHYGRDGKWADCDDLSISYPPQFGTYED